LKNPLIFSSVAWALASAGYAMWQVPEAPLSSPELLQEQLQIRIRNIPVPTSSPRYQQFKEYYMREHDIQLQEYKVLAKQHSDAASFNWRAMLQGFGVGSMLLAAGLAVLEYHCGLISYWMEVAEDYWSDCQQRRALQRAKSLEQADHRKVERLLQEIGEEEGPGPGKAVKTRRPKDADTSAMRRPKPEAAAFPPSQPLPTKEAAKAGDAESKNPTLLQPKAAANAAALREQIRSKVIERHCLQQIAATQEPAAPLPTQEKLETSKQVEEVKKNGPKRKGKKDAEVRKKKEVEVSVSTGAKKADMKKSRDPDVEAALQKLAKTAPVSSGRVSGPELLREAQELLSRLEAEDFLRELETEEERAKRAAGKKKAKKARARAKDKKAEPEKTAPVEAFSSPPAPQPLEEVSSESEVEEKITALEDKNSSPSSVEDSTEVQSLDDDRSSSDSERSSSKKGSGASPPCTPPEPSSWSHDSHGHGQRLRSWADVQDETTWNDVAEVVLRTRRRNGGVVNLPQPQEVKRTAKPAKAPAPAAPNRGQARAPQDADKRDKAWRGKAPWAKEEAPRQRPCNYAEAAGGHRLPVEVQELMSSMGIAGSRDDLIAFLNANSSKEWRAWKGDLSSYSMKDLSGFASELLKRMEQPEMPRGADGFDGAVAGAQILEWVRGGKTDYKETWTSSTDTPEAQSHLRAEAPEFVPAAESSEVAPTIMTVAVPAELPPGCQIVMVPVQLGQMPQNMVFEEQMSSEMPVAIMPGPPYGGMQMMAMPCELPSMESLEAPPTPVEATVEEKTPEYCGYNTDDECESIFGDAAESTLRRQKTF